jgi:hypothetical protein
MPTNFPINTEKDVHKGSIAHVNFGDSVEGTTNLAREKNDIST